MRHKETPFLMAVPIAIVGLIWAQIAAPAQYKPLTSHLLDYPNSMPSISLQRGIYNSKIAPINKQDSLTQTIFYKIASLLPQQITIAMIKEDNDGGGGAATNNKGDKEDKGDRDDEDNKDDKQDKQDNEDQDGDIQVTTNAKTVEELRAETYKELYGNEPGHYGYVYPDGTIAGTYIGSDGKPRTIATQASLKAADDFNQSLGNKLASLTDKELLDIAKQSDPSKICDAVDLDCQKRIIAETLSSFSNQVLVTKNTSLVKSIADSKIISDFVSMSDDELKQKYRDITQVKNLIASLTPEEQKKYTTQRSENLAILATAQTTNTESVVNGQTVYTATTTYKNPVTGEVLDTQKTSFIVEENTQLEKTDEGFVKHTTVLYRDSTTKAILDAKTTSLIEKSTTRTYKTAGKGSGGTVETVQINKTTLTDADTQKIVATQNTYSEISAADKSKITIFDNTTKFTPDGKGTSTITKSTIANPNYIAPTTPSTLTSTAPFTVKLGSICESDMDCESGSCGKVAVMAVKGSCQVNTKAPPVTDPASCADGTTLTCRGASCSCLTTDQQANLTNLEKMNPTSSGTTTTAPTPELIASISLNHNTSVTNLNNYAYCQGDEACNMRLTSADTGLSALPGFDRYKEAFSPDKASKAWQYTGYSSLEECKQSNSSTSILCDMPTRSLEQLTASTQLGTSVTAAGAAIGAIPTMIIPAVSTSTTLLGAGAATLTSSLGAVGAVSTLYQTGNATVTCLDGSENCARDAGFAVLSWANLGTMEIVSSAFASGVTSQMQLARVLNTSISVANAGTDLIQAREGCFGENATTANCVMSAGAVVFDLVGGFFDYRNGQFLWSKLPDTNIPPATLLQVAGAVPAGAAPDTAGLAVAPDAPKVTADVTAPTAPSLAIEPTALPDAPKAIETHSLSDLSESVDKGDIALKTFDAASEIADIEESWDETSLARSSKKIARIQTIEILDPVIKAKSDAFNTILDDFEKSVGYHLYEEQVQTLLSSDAISQLKTADGGSLAGKTDAITRILSVTEPKSMALFKGTTEAIEYIKSQMLSVGGKKFFGSQNTIGIYVDSKLGFLEIDFNTNSFDPNLARRMSADEVADLLKQNTNSPGTNHVTFVADRPNAVWTNLGGNETPATSFFGRLTGQTKPPTPEGLLMKQITNGDQGEFLYIVDEISDDIKKNMAISEQGVALAKVKDTKLLGGLKNGNEVINTYKEISNIETSPTHAAFFESRLAEIRGNIVNGIAPRGRSNLLIDVGSGQYLPEDINIQSNSLADIIEQSLKKTGSRKTALGQELDSLISKLRDASSNNDAIKELDVLLAKVGNAGTSKELSLYTDLSFRKAALQDDWNQFARIPGTDFHQEANDLVLYSNSASTGERLPSTTQIVSFYDKGSKMLEAASENMLGGKRIDVKQIPDFTEIKISPPGSQMNVTDFYDDIRIAKHKIRGLDATPQEAINILNMNQKINAESLKPTNFATAASREGLALELVGNRQSKYSDMSSAIVFAGTNNDMSADLQAVVKAAHEKGTPYNTVIVTQYGQKPNGETVEEFIEYAVKDGVVDFDSRKTFDNSAQWNDRAQSMLASQNGEKPKDLLIAYMGRERGADLKVTANHEYIRWAQFTDGQGKSLPTSVSFEQMWRRNRLAADSNNAIRLDPTKVEFAQEFDLYLTTERTDLTADNVYKDFYVENLNQKMATDRLDETMRALGNAPKKALSVLDTLPEKLNLGTFNNWRLNNLKAELSQRASSFETMLRSSSSREALKGTDLYAEIYRRAESTNNQLLSMAETIGKRLGLSGDEFNEVKKALNARDPADFPKYDEFFAELQSPTTKLTPPETFSPADTLMAYAKNNSIDEATAGQYKAATEKYIASSAQNINIGPTTSTPIARITPLTPATGNQLTNSPLLSPFINMGLTIMRQASNTMTKDEQALAQAKFNLDTIEQLATNDQAYISEKDLADAKVRYQQAEHLVKTGYPLNIPILADESLMDTLSRPGADLGFITSKDDRVHTFKNNNGQITYTANSVTREVTLLEALNLVPKPGEISVATRGSQDFSPSEYRVLADNSEPILSQVFSFGQSLVEQVSNAISPQQQTSSVRSILTGLFNSTNNVANFEPIISSPAITQDTESARLPAFLTDPGFSSVIYEDVDNRRYEIAKQADRTIIYTQHDPSGNLEATHNFDPSTDLALLPTGAEINSIIHNGQNIIIGSNNPISISQPSDVTIFLANEGDTLTFTLRNREKISVYNLKGNLAYIRGRKNQFITTSDLQNILPDASEVDFVTYNGVDLPSATYSVHTTSPINTTPKLIATTTKIGQTLAERFPSLPKILSPSPLETQATNITPTSEALPPAIDLAALPKQLEFTKTELLNYEVKYFSSSNFSETSEDPDFYSGPFWIRNIDRNSNASPLAIRVPKKVPLQSVIKINGVTTELSKLVDKDNDILINFGDTIEYGNITLKIGIDTSKDGNRQTDLEWAIRPDPNLDLQTQLAIAFKLLGAERQSAIANLHTKLGYRYNQITRLQSLIANTISTNPKVKRQDLLNLVLVEAQKSELGNFEINNLLFTVNSLMLQHEKVEELKLQYPDARELWNAAFGFYPEGATNVIYSYSNLTLVNQNESDFAKAYKTDGTAALTNTLTKEEIDNINNKFGAFHQDITTIIENTENIFNVSKATPNTTTQEEHIEHEIQHGMFTTNNLVLGPNTGSKSTQKALNAITAKIKESYAKMNDFNVKFVLSKNRKDLNLTLREQHLLAHAKKDRETIFLERDNEIIHFDPSDDKFRIYQGEGIKALTRLISSYSFEVRYTAESEVANELLAQITGKQLSGKIWFFNRSNIIEALKLSNYTFFTKDSTAVDDSFSEAIPKGNYPTNKTNQENDVFRNMTIGKYYTAEAQSDLVYQGLLAYETLLKKGYTHAEATILLQSTRLAFWRSLSRRLPDIRTDRVKLFDLLTFNRYSIWTSTRTSARDYSALNLTQTTPSILAPKITSANLETNEKQYLKDKLATIPGLDNRYAHTSTSNAGYLNDMDTYIGNSIAPAAPTGNISNTGLNQVRRNVQVELERLFNTDEKSKNPISRAIIVWQTNRYIQHVRQAMAEGDIRSTGEGAMTLADIQEIMLKNLHTLAFQDYVSTENTLGTHGLRHLVEHNIKIAEEVLRLAKLNKTHPDKIRAIDYLVVHQIMIDHDTGYATSIVRAGVNTDATQGYDSGHNVLAARILRERTQDGTDPLARLFGAENIAIIHAGIMTHDGSSVDISKDRTTTISSAIHLADNTHAFESKLPELLYGYPESITALRLLKAAGEIGDNDLIQEIRAKLVISIQSNPSLAKDEKVALSNAANTLTVKSYDFTMGRIMGNDPRITYENGKLVVSVTESDIHQDIVGLFDRKAYDQFVKFVIDLQHGDKPKADKKVIATEVTEAIKNNQTKFESETTIIQALIGEKQKSTKKSPFEQSVAGVTGDAAFVKYVNQDNTQKNLMEAQLANLKVTTDPGEIGIIQQRLAGFHDVRAQLARDYLRATKTPTTPVNLDSTAPQAPPVTEPVTTTYDNSVKPFFDFVFIDMPDVLSQLSPAPRQEKAFNLETLSFPRGVNIETGKFNIWNYIFSFVYTNTPWHRLNNITISLRTGSIDLAEATTRIQALKLADPTKLKLIDALNAKSIPQTTPIEPAPAANQTTDRDISNIKIKDQTIKEHLDAGHVITITFTNNNLGVIVGQTAIFERSDSGAYTFTIPNLETGTKSSNRGSFESTIPGNFPLPTSLATGDYSIRIVDRKSTRVVQRTTDLAGLINSAPIAPISTSYTQETPPPPSEVPSTTDTTPDTTPDLTPTEPITPPFFDRLFLILPQGVQNILNPVFTFTDTNISPWEELGLDLAGKLASRQEELYRENPLSRPRGINLDTGKYEQKLWNRSIVGRYNTPWHKLNKIVSDISTGSVKLEQAIARIQDLDLQQPTKDKLIYALKAAYQAVAAPATPIVIATPINEVKIMGQTIQDHLDADHVITLGRPGGQSVVLTTIANRYKAIFSEGKEIQGSYKDAILDSLPKTEDIKPGAYTITIVDSVTKGELVLKTTDLSTIISPTPAPSIAPTTTSTPIITTTVAPVPTDSKKYLLEKSPLIDSKTKTIDIERLHLGDRSFIDHLEEGSTITITVKNKNLRRTYGDRITYSKVGKQYQITYQTETKRGNLDKLKKSFPSAGLLTVGNYTLEVKNKYNDKVVRATDLVDAIVASGVGIQEIPVAIAVEPTVVDTSIEAGRKIGKRVKKILVSTQPQPITSFPLPADIVYGNTLTFEGQQRILTPKSSDELIQLINDYLSANPAKPSLAIKYMSEDRKINSHEITNPYYIPAPVEPRPIAPTPVPPATNPNIVQIKNGETVINLDITKTIKISTNVSWVGESGNQAFSTVPTFKTAVELQAYLTKTRGGLLTQLRRAQKDAKDLKVKFQLTYTDELNKAKTVNLDPAHEISVSAGTTTPAPQTKIVELISTPKNKLPENIDKSKPMRWYAEGEAEAPITIPSSATTDAAFAQELDNVITQKLIEYPTKVITIYYWDAKYNEEAKKSYQPLKKEPAVTAPSTSKFVLPSDIAYLTAPTLRTNKTGGNVVVINRTAEGIQNTIELTFAKRGPEDTIITLSYSDKDGKSKSVSYNRAGDLVQNPILGLPIQGADAPDFVQTIYVLPENINFKEAVYFYAGNPPQYAGTFRSSTGITDIAATQELNEYMNIMRGRHPDSEIIIRYTDNIATNNEKKYPPNQSAPQAPKPIVFGAERRSLMRQISDWVTGRTIGIIPNPEGNDMLNKTIESAINAGKRLAASILPSPAKTQNQMPKIINSNGFSDYLDSGALVFEKNGSQDYTNNYASFNYKTGQHEISISVADGVSAATNSELGASMVAQYFTFDDRSSLSRSLETALLNSDSNDQLIKSFFINILDSIASINEKLSIAKEQYGGKVNTTVNSVTFRKSPRSNNWTIGGMALGDGMTFLIRDNAIFLLTDTTDTDGNRLVPGAYKMIPVLSGLITYPSQLTRQQKLAGQNIPHQLDGSLEKKTSHIPHAYIGVARPGDIIFTTSDGILGDVDPETLIKTIVDVTTNRKTGFQFATKIIDKLKANKAFKQGDDWSLSIAIIPSAGAFEELPGCTDCSYVVPLITNLLLDGYNKKNVATIEQSLALAKSHTFDDPDIQLGIEGAINLILAEVSGNPVTYPYSLDAIRKALAYIEARRSHIQGGDQSIVIPGLTDLPPIVQDVLANLPVHGTIAARTPEVYEEALKAMSEFALDAQNSSTPISLSSKLTRYSKNLFLNLNQKWGDVIKRGDKMANPALPIIGSIIPSPWLTNFLNAPISQDQFKMKINDTEDGIKPIQLPPVKSEVARKIFFYKESWDYSRSILG